MRTTADDLFRDLSLANYLTPSPDHLAVWESLCCSAPRPHHQRHQRRDQKRRSYSSAIENGIQLRRRLFLQRWQDMATGVEREARAVSRRT
jgi:hypothetical protein